MLFCAPLLAPDLPLKVKRTADLFTNSDGLFLLRLEETLEFVCVLAGHGRVWGLLKRRVSIKFCMENCRYK
jgi:hypothetical protein